MRNFWVGCAALLWLEGCLSNNYQVSHAELVRLAERPPALRGEQVRVLQQTSFGADDLDDLSDRRTSLSVNADLFREDRGPVAPPGGGANGRSASGGAEAEHHVPARGGSVSGGSVRGGSTGGGSVRGGSVRGSSVRGSTSGGGASWGGSGNASDAIVIAIVAVVVANGVGVGLAVVEGRRFDGWARVHPDEGVFLRTKGAGEWLPLSSLTASDAASADHAVLVGRTANVLRLDRAPLSRKGFAYEVELGTAQLNTVTGTRDFGFASRTGLGYFPTPRLGFLLAEQVAFGRSQDRWRGGAIFNGRFGAELEYLPVRVASFHAGFYAELGGALAIQDRPERSHAWSGLYAASGFLAQVDWTTRLALNLRGGLAALPAHPGSTLLERTYVPELTLGISVY